MRATCCLVLWTFINGREPEKAHGHRQGNATTSTREVTTKVESLTANDVSHSCCASPETTDVVDSLQDDERGDMRLKKKN